MARGAPRVGMVHGSAMGKPRGRGSRGRRLWGRPLACIKCIAVKSRLMHSSEATRAALPRHALAMALGREEREEQAREGPPARERGAKRFGFKREHRVESNPQDLGPSS